MVVPEEKVFDDERRLKMVTVHFAFSPTSFLPVASRKSSPSTVVEMLLAAIICLEKSVGDVVEKVTCVDCSTSFGLTVRVTVAFVLNK